MPGSGSSTGSARHACVLCAASPRPVGTDLTVEERNASVIGIVRLTMQMEVLAITALKLLSTGDVFATFADVTGVSDYSSDPFNSSFTLTTDGIVLNGQTLIDDQNAAVLTTRYLFTIADRTWAATFYATPDFVSSRRSFAPYTIVIVLVLMTAMAIAGGCHGHVVVLVVADTWLTGMACLACLARGTGGQALSGVSCAPWRPCSNCPR